MKLRWGILGAGRIAAEMIPFFARTEGAVLTAVASRSVERATELIRAAGCAARALDSYDELVAAADVDVVYVTLPNSMHAAWSIRAARSGKHVLCEKPLAAAPDEAARIIAACHEMGVILMDGFAWRHHRRTTQLRKLLDGGEIGRVRRVFAAFTNGRRALAPDDFRLRPDLGGGCLLDLGCYTVLGILWAFASDPLRLSATARFEAGIDLEATGWLEFADGGVGVFDCGFCAPFRNSMEIVGSEGTLSISDMWFPVEAPATYVKSRGRNHERVLVENVDQRIEMLERFCRAVREGVAPREWTDEAVRCLTVLDGLRRAARSLSVIDADNSKTGRAG